MIRGFKCWFFGHAFADIDLQDPGSLDLRGIDEPTTIEKCTRCGHEVWE